MRSIALVIAFFMGLIVPAVAQKANIEAANAKWMEFFTTCCASCATRTDPYGHAITGGN